MAIGPSLDVAQKLSDFAFSRFIVVDYDGSIFYMLFGFTFLTIPLRSNRCCSTMRFVRPAGSVCSVP